MIAAGDILAQVNADRFDSTKPATWGELKDRYRTEKFPDLRRSSQLNVEATLKLVDDVIGPHLAKSLNEKTIPKLWDHLRTEKRSEATINRHKRTLRAIVRWAKQNGIVATAPHIGTKVVKGAKGRALTGEEIDRLHAQARKQLGDRAESWVFLLKGLEYSGLRLGEALECTWDDTSRIWIDWSGQRPALVIPAHMQKGDRDTVMPMSDEMIALLQSVEECERGPFVFNPEPERDHKLQRPRLDTVSATICELGKAAGIKTKDHTDQAKVKFASAHDLRRTFGSRMATRVPAQVLQKLMRHASIQTTLEFYVDLDERDLIDAAFGASPESTNVSTNIAAPKAR